MPIGQATHRLASRSALALLLPWLLVGCGGDSETELSLPGFANNEMLSPEAAGARLTLERYLEAMAVGDYQQAALEFSGDVRDLRNLNEDVAPDDIPELLSRFCLDHGGACLPAEIVKGRKAGHGKYVFDVEFHKADGTLFQTGDTLVVETLESGFSFRVERIGTRFFVLDLPPRRPSL
jgi:hypothetical protein